ncbi:11471_t:CDS:2 [Gigaspora margarita]|uniref:11471_t:CDS:1 n=1 Tax=Gigaspora margarita TaxID=4874 RepID=A0ABN7UVL8_GIGMA|nr:11471_t:CDS:2 [Gigaspora margarita]
MFEFLTRRNGNISEQSGVLSGANPMVVNASDPLTLAIIQIVIIVVFTRILHLGLKRIRQPRVISEVIGGIILGPSVLGHIPGYMNTIFPTSSLTYLNLLANLGLLLYLFIVGLELNPTMIRKSIKTVISISASGIILPFALGVGVAYGLYDSAGNQQVVDSKGFIHDVPFASFLLFICVAMAITAFPVLARILSELKLMRTPVGSCALNSAVGDDITAWILLALVIAIINASNYLTALYSFLICAGWTLIVGFIVRPILLKLIVLTNSNQSSPSTLMVAITLSTVLLSGFITNIIGIHYIFGGFIIGVVLPHEGGFAYFTLSGLKTNISDLGATGWGWVILIIVVAMIGKITGCTLAARATGLTFREALTVGVFMSCKGLVELIILNVGYDASIINSKDLESKESPHSKDDLRLLVVLNKVENLPAMVTFVQLLQHNDVLNNKSTSKNSEEQSELTITKPMKPTMSVYVLRLIELTQRMSAVMKFNEISETILHDPIMNMFSAISQVSSVKVDAKLAVASPKDFCPEITDRIQDADINLVIIPWGGAGEIVDTPIENDDHHVPREKKHTSPHVATFVQGIFNEAANYASVGVFVDRGFGSIDSNTRTIPNPMGYLRVFVPFFGGADDREALNFAFKLLEYPNVNITVLRIIKSDQPTGHEVTLKPETQIEVPDDDEKNRPPLDRQISTISISEAVENQENKDDESFLEKNLKSKTGYPARNARISYQEISSNTPIQTAVERAREIVHRKDLVIVGRSRHSHANERHHHGEFRELIRNLGSYGNDTYKSLGYVSEAFLVGGVVASLLVLQAKNVEVEKK